MTKTAAIAIARQHCAIWGRGTSWTVSGPYYWTVSGPYYGPTTEHQCSSYARAVAIRTIWRARIAISMLIEPDAEAAYAARWAIEEVMHDPYTRVPRTLAALVTVGLAAART